MIRDLYSQGLSISERTDKDRETVRKYARQKIHPEMKKSSVKLSKLDLYKPYRIEKLNEAPYTAARLFHEIKEQGYDGGETIVKDLKRKVRLHQGVTAVLRYETKTGVQAQVD